MMFNYSWTCIVRSRVSKSMLLSIMSIASSARQKQVLESRKEREKRGNLEEEKEGKTESDMIEEVFLTTKDIIKTERGSIMMIREQEEVQDQPSPLPQGLQ